MIPKWHSQAAIHQQACLQVTTCRVSWVLTISNCRQTILQQLLSNCVHLCKRLHPFSNIIYNADFDIRHATVLATWDFYVSQPITLKLGSKAKSVCQAGKFIKFIYKDNHFNLLRKHWHHTVCFIAIVTLDVQLPILSGTIQWIFWASWH